MKWISLFTFATVIYMTSGQEIASGTCSGTTVINASDVEAGRYYLQLSTSENMDDMPCGLLNTSDICSCIILDLPPATEDNDTNTFTTYGLPSGAEEYEPQSIVLRRSESGIGIFDFQKIGMDKEGEVVFGVVASDDYATYFCARICPEATTSDVPNKAWIFTRDQFPSDTVISTAMEKCMAAITDLTIDVVIPHQKCAPL